MEVQDASVFCIDFCIGFCAIWVPAWGPSWAHVGLFCATRRTQNPLKKQQTLKTAQDASWTPPGSLQTSILVPLDLDFRRIFDRCLDAFGHFFSCKISKFFFDDLIFHHILEELKKKRFTA